MLFVIVIFVVYKKKRYTHLKLKIMTTKRPIGQLKSKVIVYCEICGCSSRRNLKEFVYENTPEKIKEAKDKIKVKAEKEYTCRICKSIKKDLS